MHDCVFCKIIAGDIPSHNVYEDDICLAFADIHPVREGHILVVPKVHVSNWIDLDDEILSHIIKASKVLGKAIDQTYRPVKVGYTALGFDVDHVHFHILPMHDRLDITHGHDLMELSQDELAESVEKIKKVLLEERII